MAPPPHCPAAPISADLLIPNERWWQLRDPARWPLVAKHGLGKAPGAGAVAA